MSSTTLKIAELASVAIVCALVSTGIKASPQDLQNEQANYNSRISTLTGTVDAYRPQIDYIANAGDEVLNAECAFQQDCVDIYKEQQHHLRKALQMLDFVTGK